MSKTAKVLLAAIGGFVAGILLAPKSGEETRKDMQKVARNEAENAKVAIRNIRRDVLGDIKSLLKDKEISEDDERRAGDDIQKITDKYVAEVDKRLAAKEAELMKV